MLASSRPVPPRLWHTFANRFLGPRGGSVSANKRTGSRYPLLAAWKPPPRDWLPNLLRKILIEERPSRSAAAILQAVALPVRNCFAARPGDSPPSISFCAAVTVFGSSGGRPDGLRFRAVAIPSWARSAITRRSIGASPWVGRLERVSTPCPRNVHPVPAVYQLLTHVRAFESPRICNVSPLDRPYFAPKRSKTGFRSRVSFDRRPLSLHFVSAWSPRLSVSPVRRVHQQLGALLGGLTSTLP